MTAGARACDNPPTGEEGAIGREPANDHQETLVTGAGVGGFVSESPAAMTGLALRSSFVVRWLIAPAVGASCSLGARRAAPGEGPAKPTLQRAWTLRW